MVIAIIHFVALHGTLGADDLNVWRHTNTVDRGVVASFNQIDTLSIESQHTRIEDLFKFDYFRLRIQFGFLFEPLLLSFNATVSVASMEDLHRTAMLWVDQNCSLVELRPGNL